MAFGMTNGTGKTGYLASQAFETAAEAKAAVDSAPSLVPATDSRDGYMTKEQAGKLDGIEVGATKYTHPKSGVTAGKYQSVTVDDDGHVTQGESFVFAASPTQPEDKNAIWFKTQSETAEAGAAEEEDTGDGADLG